MCESLAPAVGGIIPKGRHRHHSVLFWWPSVLGTGFTVPRRGRGSQGRTGGHTARSVAVTHGAGWPGVGFTRGERRGGGTATVPYTACIQARLPAAGRNRSVRHHTNPTAPPTRWVNTHQFSILRPLFVSGGVQAALPCETNRRRA